MSRQNLSLKAYTRLNAIEFTAWTEKCKVVGVKRARLLRKWIREWLTGLPDVFGTELQIFRDAVREMTAVGRNLNQLVKLLNQGGEFRNPEVLSLLNDVLQAVGQMENKLKEILSITRKRTLK